VCQHFLSHPVHLISKYWMARCLTKESSWFVAISYFTYIHYIHHRLFQLIQFSIHVDILLLWYFDNTVWCWYFWHASWKGSYQNDHLVLHFLICYNQEGYYCNSLYRYVRDLIFQALTYFKWEVGINAPVHTVANSEKYLG